MSFCHSLRRLIAVLLAAVLIGCAGLMTVCAYDVSGSFQATSYYQRLSTVKLTGDYREDLCHVALSQVGYHESGDNITEYGAYFKINGSAWCGAFVSWCARQAGIPTSTIATCYGTSAEGFGVSYRDVSYTPVPGDLIFFSHGHVGIVYSVDASNIYIVHGNWSDQVCSSAIARDGWLDLQGYGISGFGTYLSFKQNKLTVTYNANRGTIPNADQTVTQYTVKPGTGGINLREGADTSYAVLTLLPEGTSFTVSETKTVGDYTWGRTAYAGKSGWAVISRSDWVSTSSVSASTYKVASDGTICLASGAVHQQIFSEGVTYADGLYDDTTFHIERTGYSFLGWSLSPDGGKILDKTTPRSAEDIDPSVSEGNKSVTVYAIWQKGASTLTYDANGGTGAPLAETRATEKVLSGVLPIRKGYTFLGWSTDPNATEPTYRAGDLYAGRDDETLYAVWRKNRLTIRYHANSGLIASTRYKADEQGLIRFAVDDAAVSETWDWNSNVPYGLYNASTFGLTKTGFTFLGWSTNPSCTNLFKEDDETFLSQELNAALDNGDAEVDLYAVWKRAATAQTVLIGDLDGDGEVTGKDRILLSRFVSDSFPLANPAAADINADGVVSVLDRIYLSRYLAGWGFEYDLYFR